MKARGGRLPLYGVERRAEVSSPLIAAPQPPPAPRDAVVGRDRPPNGWIGSFGIVRSCSPSQLGRLAAPVICQNWADFGIDLRKPPFCRAPRSIAARRAAQPGPGLRHCYVPRLSAPGFVSAGRRVADGSLWRLTRRTPQPAIIRRIVTRMKNQPTPPGRASTVAPPRALDMAPSLPTPAANPTPLERQLVG